MRDPSSPRRARWRPRPSTLSCGHTHTQWCRWRWGNVGKRWSEGSAPISSPQSVRQWDPFMKGLWGRWVLCHPEHPHLNAVRIPAVLHPFLEGALGQYRVTELRFFGTIWHCHSGILDRVHTRTHTHITQHLLYLLLRPKTLVPPLSYTVNAHIHSQTHSQSCTEGSATPPPVHLSGRLSQLLIPSARAQTQTCREVSQRLHQKPLWKKPLNHEPRMFSCIYLFYNIVCIYVCVKIWYIY